MKYFLLVVFAIATVGTFFVAPASSFPDPELARVIFFHLPCAFLTTGFLIFAAIAGGYYLKTKDWVWEARSYAANDIATTLAIATMITGIIFSKVQWGAWWHWDPRQTSFLIVMLLQGAYFAIRMAFDDEVARARVSAAYSTLMLLPVLFLIFVFPRLPQVAKNSLHPQDTVAKGKFSADYYSVVLGITALLLVTCIWLYKMHVRATVLDKQLRDQDGNLETDSSGTAPRRVGEPVSLH